MHRTAAADLEAYSAYFARSGGGIEPDAGGTLQACSREAIVCQQQRDGIFQRSYKGCRAHAQRIEVKDRVHDQLARTVVGDITAALYLMKGCTYCLRAEEHIGRIAGFAQCIGVGMLAKDQGIVCGQACAFGGQVSLIEPELQC